MKTNTVALVIAPALPMVDWTPAMGTAFSVGGTFLKLFPPLANPFGPRVDVGTAPAGGTIVASRYIIFDPGPAQSIAGRVKFDSTVIARGLEASYSVTISGARQILFDTSRVPAEFSPAAAREPGSMSLLGLAWPGSLRLSTDAGASGRLKVSFGGGL